MFKYGLGLTAKDIITGVRGIITGRVEYLTGCNQYLIQPKSQKDSKANSYWFDEQRLAIQKDKKIELDNSDGNGADMEAPRK